MDHFHNIPILQQFLSDESATRQFGHLMASCIQAGMVIYLQGDLGAGKTTLTRGVLEALGVTGRVKSPTYSLVEIYDLPEFEFYHFDLYRFTNPFEWIDAGFREYFHAKSVCLIEWPEKGEGFLPAADLVITLSMAADARIAEVMCCRESIYACLKSILNHLS